MLSKEEQAVILVVQRLEERPVKSRVGEFSEVSSTKTENGALRTQQAKVKKE